MMEKLDLKIKVIQLPVTGYEITIWTQICVSWKCVLSIQHDADICEMLQKKTQQYLFTVGVVKDHHWNSEVSGQQVTSDGSKLIVLSDILKCGKYK